MTASPDEKKGGDSMWRWWPCFIGGFCGPLLANVLESWLSPGVAVGSSFFIMWLLVGLIFTVSPPSRTWRLARWAAGGAVGAVVAGVLTAVAHS